MAPLALTLLLLAPLAWTPSSLARSSSSLARSSSSAQRTVGKEHRC